MIASGQASVVLIVADDAALSGRSAGSVYAGGAQFESPYGTLAPALCALFAQHHMHEFGTTPEQLAEVSAASPRHVGLSSGSSAGEAGSCMSSDSAIPLRCLRSLGVGRALS